MSEPSRGDRTDRRGSGPTVRERGPDAVPSTGAASRPRPEPVRPEDAPHARSARPEPAHPDPAHQGSAPRDPALAAPPSAPRDVRSADAAPAHAGAPGETPALLGAPVRPAPARPAPRHGRGAAPEAPRTVVDGTLRRRLGALRELIGLSRTRLDGAVLAEAGRVLDEAGARAQLSGAYTTVAIAGATGGGKSTLFNALAGRALSEVGLRRPTTAEPVACTWEAEREGGADGLLDRLGVPPATRRRVKDAELHGLVLIDLPDHDSVEPGHREQVDRLLRLVDAVVWVVDPEKYADAMLHERYLRPMARHAEVTFVVLNQVDRLPGEAADAVLHDLRRLLDEDGVALGEHGEPGAEVMALSALTGEGVPELRQDLAAFVAARQAAARRLTADLDGATERLRPVYADPALPRPAGLTEQDREEFEDRLAAAVGAAAAGQSAERAWLRHAERACGTPWSQLVRWVDTRRQRAGEQRSGGAVPGPDSATAGEGPAGGPGAVPPAGGGDPAVSGAEPSARSAGRDAGAPPAGPFVRSAPDAAHAGTPGGTGRGHAADPGALDAAHDPARVARPLLAQAVRDLSDRAVRGLPEAWRETVRAAARRGAEGLPEALDRVVGDAWGGPGAVPGDGPPGGGAPGDAPRAVRGDVRGDVPGEGTRPARLPRPAWWVAATAAQGLLMALQVLGLVLLTGAVLGAYGGGLWGPVFLLLGGAVAGPLLAALCRAAARGPARAFGREEERRLRRLAAACGRTRVLEPVAAELLRYREVREQYVIAAGDAEL
ncbi:GTPase [Streptomyces sp. JJ36]|uniref:GTPase n=1 Tax=Streptomyces sp. JJ36 TaxID=2736645 RepID=UPI001EFFC6E4|nr:GTPase [Streptomyces sp. JJ36]MCF6525038.1 50S ribosome-binding GTPase [Streptomyces sp. JJ36]